MKRIIIVAVALSAAFTLSARTESTKVDTAKVVSTKSSKKDIVKTGWNIGPLPAIAYDADKGFQLGAIIQLFNYGDGHNYPNYDRKWYGEASFFSKGSLLLQLRYDDKELIPGVRWSSAARINIDKAYDFYGFNGYRSYYDYARVAEGKSGEKYYFTPFYRYRRYEARFKSDFIGKITDDFMWEAGVFAEYYRIRSIDYDNINRGKEESQEFPKDVPTLFDIYKQTGVLTPREANGGITCGLRGGLVYDTRDKEGAPSRGIWAEAHIKAAPSFVSEYGYCRYSATFRHYVPILYNDVLTFAYRINYEGTIGDFAPFYVLPYMSVMGERIDYEGMGGYNTTRGIMRTRVVGLDMLTYNAELRWRFVKFRIGKQNIALALNAFSDGTMVTRGRDLSALGNYTGQFPILSELSTDKLHATFGAGFRFIMNENFIVAVEYGMPFSKIVKKTNPIYGQDGDGALYVNIGYLF